MAEIGDSIMDLHMYSIRTASQTTRGSIKVNNDTIFWEPKECIINDSIYINSAQTGQDTVPVTFCNNLLRIFLGTDTLELNRTPCEFIILDTQKILGIWYEFMERYTIEQLEITPNNLTLRVDIAYENPEVFTASWTMVNNRLYCREIEKKSKTVKQLSIQSNGANGYVLFDLYYKSDTLFLMYTNMRTGSVRIRKFVKQSAFDKIYFGKKDVNTLADIITTLKSLEKLYKNYGTFSAIETYSPAYQLSGNHEPIDLPSNPALQIENNRNMCKITLKEAIFSLPKGAWIIISEKKSTVEETSANKSVQWEKSHEQWKDYVSLTAD